MDEGRTEEGQTAEAQTAVQTAVVRGTSVTFPATTQAYSTPPIDSAKQSIYCIEDNKQV